MRVVHLFWPPALDLLVAFNTFNYDNLLHQLSGLGVGGIFYGVSCPFSRLGVWLEMDKIQSSFKDSAPKNASVLYSIPCPYVISI